MFAHELWSLIFLRFWACLGYALFCHGAIGLLGGIFWQREDLENSFFMHNVVKGREMAIALMVTNKIDLVEVLDKDPL